MTVNARDSYLESQVLTATPQRLRLLLIEGALRFAKQVVHCWENHDNETGLEAVSRCRRIITELLTVMVDDGSEVIGQLRGIYAFMFRQLTDAQQQQNPDMVGEVIRLLEVERETWQMVCEQMPEAPQRESLAVEEKKREITAATSPRQSPDATSTGFDSTGVATPGSESAKGGFSLDA
jgi:flagellar secretion chaperone FliS